MMQDTYITELTNNEYLFVYFPEKGIVMDLIRTAVAGQEEYYKQNQYTEPQRPKTNTANMADSEPLPAGIGGADAQTLVISHPETMEKKIEK